MNREEIILVFDRQCPVCTYYCQLVRIRKQLGHVVIVDAREPSIIMDEITEKGWDVDDGIVLKIGTELYYGSDAIHRLAFISSRSDVFNRFNYWMFKSHRLSNLSYPFFKFLRRILLKVMGISKINNLAIEGNDKF